MTAHASALVFLLVVAIATAADITVSVSPRRGTVNTYPAGSGPTLIVHTNNWELGVDGNLIDCFAHYAYLEAFGRPWTDIRDVRITSCNSGRTGNCNTWYYDIPPPAQSSQVIEAVAYCRVSNGGQIWAQGSGNVMFRQEN
eukprot:m51a1_g987 hypothetical protein (141) ;mRNA; r:468951-469457